LAQNKIPFDKTKIYDRSIFSVMHEVSVEISDKKRFARNEIIKRTKLFADYIIDKWWCDVNTIKNNDEYIILDEYEENNT
jgi:hypothetical protein